MAALAAGRDIGAAAVAGGGTPIDQASAVVINIALAAGRALRSARGIRAPDFAR